MRRPLASTAFFLLLLYGFTELRAQAPRAADIASKADEYLSVCAKMNRFSGVVLLARYGKIVLRKAYGSANVEL